MAKKKYNSFLQLIKSFVAVVKAEEYITLRRQKTGSKILLAIIVAILTAVGTCALYGVTISNSKDLEELVEQIPDFSYSEGRLEVDGCFEYNQDGVYILVDSDIPYFDFESDKGNYDGSVDALKLMTELYQENSGALKQVILMSNRNMVIAADGQSQSMRYKDLFQAMGVSSFDKSIIRDNYKNVIMKTALICGAFYTPVKFGLLFFVPLFYGLIGLVVAKNKKAKSGFATTYWIAFYMNIVFVILKSVNPLLPGWVSYHKWIIRILLWIFVAIQMYRALSEEENEMPQIDSTTLYNGSYADGTPYIPGGTYNGYNANPSETNKSDGQDTI